MNVLIVEPDGTVQARRLAAFAASGHCVTAVCEGERALALLRRRPFDVMLVDPFGDDATDMSLLAATRITAPMCRIVLLTATSLFVSGELFTIMPPSIEILRAPITDRDLIIHCEEPRRRLSA